MIKLLVYLAGLALVAGLATGYLRLRPDGVAVTDPATAKRTLDEMKEKAAEIEKESRERAREIMRQTE